MLLLLKVELKTHFKLELAKLDVEFLTQHTSNSKQQFQYKQKTNKNAKQKKTRTSTDQNT